MSVLCYRLMDGLFSFRDVQFIACAMIKSLYGWRHQKNVSMFQYLCRGKCLFRSAA